MDFPVALSTSGYAHRPRFLPRIAFLAGRVVQCPLDGDVLKPHYADAATHPTTGGTRRPPDWWLCLSATAISLPVGTPVAHFTSPYPMPDRLRRDAPKDVEQVRSLTFKAANIDANKENDIMSLDAATLV